MIVEIPTEKVQSYIKYITFAGMQYALTFDWNATYDFCSLSISLSDMTPLISGIRLVTNIDLLKQYHYITNIPKGNLFLIPIVDNVEFGFETMQEFFSLVYSE